MKQCLLLSFLICGIAFSQSHKELITTPCSSPAEVTKICLSCHEDAGGEVLHSNHWRWLDEEFPSKGGTKAMGKKNFINNFCIAVPSNWARCTSCHAGYGWKDDTFDFTKADNIDCLVCHEQTGTYKKIPTGAGMPDKTSDLLAAAQSVGRPTRKNCGICHFDGGGGTGVKHGDMDDGLYEPSKDLDVHMGGKKFLCIECHKSEKHHIKGASHGSMAAGANHIYCSDCHKENVHKNASINKHMTTVACETCHIPEFARAEPTKVWWDWSKAGQAGRDSADEYGKETFNKMKGEFVWKKNVVPTYAWYNGRAEYYSFGDIADPDKIVRLNTLGGSINDPSAKIAPFKVMRGKQIFDTRNKYLIIPQLFGKDGYWTTYDWNSASVNGMKTVNLAYSGSFGFIETEMYWPINHMVAPKEKALKCASCHGANGRLNWTALGYTGDPMKSANRSTLHKKK